MSEKEYNWDTGPKTSDTVACIPYSCHELGDLTILQRPLSKCAWLTVTKEDLLKLFSLILNIRISVILK